MTHSLSSHARTSLAVILVAASAVLAACDVPTTPDQATTSARGSQSGSPRATPTPAVTPTPTPTPTPKPSPSPSPLPVATRYVVTGVVTDEDGTPVAGRFVEIDYYRGNGTFSSEVAHCPDRPEWCWLMTHTNERGEYTVELDAAQSPQRPGTIGFVYSFGGEATTQTLPFGSANITRNLRLGSTRKINAGASITVTIDPDSSLCTDLEDLWAFEYRATVIQVVVDKPGTLIIETQPAAAGGAVAMLFWSTSGSYAGFPVRTGPGALSIPVKAGTFSIHVATPIGSGTSSHNVTTALVATGSVK
jgi:hypothetical protein